MTVTKCVKTWSQAHENTVTRTYVSRQKYPKKQEGRQKRGRSEKHKNITSAQKEQNTRSVENKSKTQTTVRDIAQKEKIFYFISMFRFISMQNRAKSFDVKKD